MPVNEPSTGATALAIGVMHGDGIGPEIVPAAVAASGKNRMARAKRMRCNQRQETSVLHNGLLLDVLDALDHFPAPMKHNHALFALFITSAVLADGPKDNQVADVRPIPPPGVAVPEPEAALANKDTIILPQKSSVRVVARFDRPGEWMYHCHILEHEDMGMMRNFRIRA